MCWAKQKKVKEGWDNSTLKIWFRYKTKWKAAMNKVLWNTVLFLHGKQNKPSEHLKFFHGLTCIKFVFLLSRALMKMIILQQNLKSDKLIIEASAVCLFIRWAKVQKTVELAGTFYQPLLMFSFLCHKVSPTSSALGDFMDMSRKSLQYHGTSLPLLSSGIILFYFHATVPCSSGVSQIFL